MDTVLLKSRQVLNLEPVSQQSHPRLSLFRVLHVKLLRWIDTSSTAAILKALRRASTLLLVSALIAAPQFTLGFLTAAATWNGYRLPIFSVVLLLTLNAKRIWLAARRRATRPIHGNQHTFHGIPVAEFASFLKKNEGFKLADAEKLALSRNQYDAIAEDLDKHGITVRGEKNSRVLRPITLEQLVTQLRDKFPLLWDEVHEEWTDKEDSYGRWLRAEGFKTRKLTEDVEKKERKLERLERDISTLQGAMA